MDWHADGWIDGDLRKGAVEASLDGRDAPLRDELGRPHEAIAITEDVIDANAEQIVRAEAALGADEDGTPG